MCSVELYSSQTETGTVTLAHEPLHLSGKNYNPQHHHTLTRVKTCKTNKFYCYVMCLGVLILTFLWFILARHDKLHIVCCITLGQHLDLAGWRHGLLGLIMSSKGTGD